MKTDWNKRNFDRAARAPHLGLVAPSHFFIDSPARSSFQSPSTYTRGCGHELGPPEAVGNVDFDGADSGYDRVALANPADVQFWPCFLLRRACARTKRRRPSFPPVRNFKIQFSRSSRTSAPLGAQGREEPMTVVKTANSILDRRRRCLRRRDSSSSGGGWSNLLPARSRPCLGLDRSRNSQGSTHASTSTTS